MPGQCPCCYKTSGTCDCQLQMMTDLEGRTFRWCATHHRAIGRDDAPAQIQFPPSDDAPSLPDMP